MGRIPFLAAILLGWVMAAPVAAQQILGSGSTFVYPLMTKWIETYQKASGARIGIT